MKFPFEAKAEDVQAAPETFVDAVFASLASEFLLMPKGEGFLDYAAFASGYEDLRQATNGFLLFHPEKVLNAALESPVLLIVLRSMLGFTPPEWAYFASTRMRVVIRLFMRAARAGGQMGRPRPTGPYRGQRQGEKLENPQ